MYEQLINALSPSKYWVNSFTRYEYRQAFQQYSDSFSFMYIEALRQVSDMTTFTNSYLDAVETHWKNIHFWNRAATKVDEKMVVVSYLTPMLLNANDPSCSLFSNELCRLWNNRFPNNTYQTASYEQLLEGFRHSILGLDMESKHLSH